MSTPTMRDALTTTNAADSYPPLPDRDDAAAHIYPSDLEKFKHSETYATVFSVAVGCPDERSVPLFTADQMRAYIAADRALRASPAPTVLNPPDVEVTEESSTACDAAYAQYRKNLDGAPCHPPEAFRNGWFWREALIATPTPADRKALAGWLESEEFYNAMQGYRIAPMDDQREVVAHFENVKRRILASLPAPTQAAPVAVTQSNALADPAGPLRGDARDHRSDRDSCGSGG